MAARASQGHVAAVLESLQAKANARNVAGMARFGINTRNALGVPIPQLRQLARKPGRDHALALALWQSDIHDARLLATMIAEPAQLTIAQMDAWVEQFDSWDICDQACNNLFNRSPLAHARALAWVRRDEEFVRRAGFVLMATLAVHDKRSSDAVFMRLLTIIKRGATDERNFVKKAVNWALRQIGKRNLALQAQALAIAAELAESENAAARWIGRDARRELRSAATLARLRKKDVAARTVATS